MNKSRPYYIAAGEWMQTSMGYRAPFLLCNTLNELGYEAYVTAQKQAPALQTPLLTPEIMAKHKVNGREIIAVYNEGVWGNILQGDVVVRWIMNRLGKLVDTLPASNDIFFYWDKAYTEHPESSQILRLPAVDTSIFNQDGVDCNQRKSYAYYAHKYLRDGKGVITDQVKSGGISLCQDIPRTQQEIADILRSVKVLYIYEETALAEEAAFCGCTVVWVINSYNQELYGDIYPYDYAVFEDELDIATQWSYSRKMLAVTLGKIKTSESQIVDFISKTQNAPVYPFENDEFLTFAKNYKKIFLYGSGITSTMVYNMLRTVDARISGFITSDEYFSRDDNMRYGLPIISASQLIKENREDCGVVLAMMRVNAMQVAEDIERMKIACYCPVLL